MYGKFPVLEKLGFPSVINWIISFFSSAVFSLSQPAWETKPKLFFKTFFPRECLYLTIYHLSQGFGSGFSTLSSQPRSIEGDRMTISLRQTQEPVQGCDAFPYKRRIRQLVIQLLSQSDNKQGMELCSDFHQHCIFTSKELTVISSDMKNKTHPAASVYRKSSISTRIKLCSICFWPLLLCWGNDLSRCSLSDSSVY